MHAVLHIGTPKELSKEDQYSSKESDYFLTPFPWLGDYRLLGAPQHEGHYIRGCWAKLWRCVSTQVCTFSFFSLPIQSVISLSTQLSQMDPYLASNEQNIFCSLC